MANPTVQSNAERLLHALAMLASFTGREVLAHYLDLAARVVATTADDGPQLKALTAEIQAMVSAGRSPTPEEWAALRAKRHLLEADIAATASDGSPTVAPTPPAAPAQPAATPEAPPTAEPPST